MGCASSREARRDRRRSPAPYIRSQSMPIPSVGSSSSKVGDSNHHVVALTSSTLGTLKLEDDESMMKATNDDKTKEWSEMINRKIPKTPTKIRSNEPETINTWELMEGLEEAEIDRPRVVDKSFSFSHVDASPKPLWMQIASEDSVVSDFDPDIISKFRKALDELSPQHQSFLRSPEPTRTSISETPKFESLVKARINDFQKKIDAKRGIKKCQGPPNGERKVVIYTTSLRGVRKTYEDCWTVKMILQGYGVRIDERDVSMHLGFKEELNEILGVGFGGNRLPGVFVNGKYLGGADEVRQMHEVGELGKELEACEAAMVGKGGGVCEGCGDIRFVPCENCSGSCKVFVEDEEIACGFRRCPDCNENGLVRCPLCL